MQIIPQSGQEVQSGSDPLVADVSDELRPGLRVGVYGGSFDPVHRGHLYVARQALRAFELDSVVWIPAAAPPHKPGKVLAAGRDRLAMVRLAIEGDPGFQAVSLELDRPGPSYTVDTLTELPAELGLERPELHLILGSDNLPDFPRWHRAGEILRLAQPIVILRDEDGREELLEGLRGQVDEQQLERIARGLLPVPAVPGRATELRRRLAEGLDPGPDLPEAVASYIREHDLYRAGAGS